MAIGAVQAVVGRAAPSTPAAPFRRLLVPLDGSELAERALPCAQALARSLGADLILVRAASVGPWHGDLAEAQVKAVAEAEIYLEHVAAELTGDHAVGYSVPYGQPVEGVAEVARTRAADLIVMATHGRGGPSRLLLGSVADALVRRTQLPLLLVRAGLSLRGWEQGPRRILVPLDGSDLAESVLARVDALARVTGAQLTLLQVVGLARPVLAPYEIAPVFEGNRALADRARAYLARVASSLARAGQDVQTQVVFFGGPADRIAAAAAEGQHDLIAMATHGRAGLDRLIFGSVADQVLRTAKVPVLLFRGPSTTS